MNLKPIEMQIAIPRTYDAGIVQQQLNQKPQLDQNLLAAQAARQAEEARHQSAQVERSSSAHVDDGQAKRQQQRSSPKRKAGAAKASAQAQPNHPYKGQHIDFSL